MEPLSKVLEEVIKKYGFKRKLQKQRLEQEFAQIVGEVFAQNLKIVRFENKRLVLVASDPGWSHQASLMKNEFMKKINNYFEEEIVKEIRVKN